MPSNETPADVALRYVRDELSTLRGAMHDELSAIRSDLSDLAGEMRAHMTEHGPRVAVLEHRVAEAERTLAALHDQRSGDRAQRWAVWMTVLAALLAATTPTILRLLGS